MKEQRWQRRCPNHRSMHIISGTSGGARRPSARRAPQPPAGSEVGVQGRTVPRGGVGILGLEAAPCCEEFQLCCLGRWLVLHKPRRARAGRRRGSKGQVSRGSRCCHGRWPRGGRWAPAVGNRRALRGERQGPKGVIQRAGSKDGPGVPGPRLARAACRTHQGGCSHSMHATTGADQLSTPQTLLVEGPVGQPGAQGQRRHHRRCWLHGTLSPLPPIVEPIAKHRQPLRASCRDHPTNGDNRDGAGGPSRARPMGPITCASAAITTPAAINVHKVVVPG